MIDIMSEVVVPFLGGRSTAVLLTRQWQRFLTASTLRPGSDSAIADHWLPTFSWRCNRIWSSSLVHSPASEEVL